MSTPLLRHPLQKIDLKLLACLEAMLTHRQVSGAARALGMDQPSMSAALARLRELFDDPLFTRVGQGMVPTPRALALAGPVHQLLRGADELLQETERELGTRLEGEFHLMLGSDFLATLVLPVLAQVLQQHMPGFRIQVLPPNPQGVLQTYAQGVVDLGVGYLPKPPPTLYRQVLLREPWVGLCRRGHPLLEGERTPRRFADAVFLQVSPGGSGSYGRILDSALSTRGLQRSFGMTVPHYGSAPSIVEASDLVAVVPQALGRAAERTHGVVAFELPLAVDPLEISMHWHESTRHSAVHQRVRQHLVEHFAQRRAAPQAVAEAA
ncbi:MAG TPA: LysR family transcriptional regulator [Ramlibacter sp.]|nr:LysR family transcriptional regulator [Ramlibacter sp.]